MSNPPSPSHEHLPTRDPSPPPPSSSRRSKYFSSFPQWKGGKPLPFIISIGIGLLLNFAVPKPHQLSRKAWQLLAIFITTIAGVILSPLPASAWALTCLTIAIITKTLTFTAAFSAFTNEVIWLIVASFFFSRGFVKTGLGERLAMLFVRWLGKSTLGLSYGLVLSEVVISPAMPSSTARAGGIFLPIIKSLAEASDSRPKDESARKLGAFLVQSQLQSASSSSALFLTAAAQNLLCIKLAEGLGVQVPNRWVTWFKASSLPAVVSLLATPVIVYKLFPPTLKHTPDAPIIAKEKLERMGPVNREEWLMIGTMVITVALWISGEHINVSSVVAALLGLSLLLLSGVLEWDDCLSEKSAWDTLAWFGVLVGMAGQLTTLGVVPWLADRVANLLKSLSVNSLGGFVRLPAVFRLGIIMAIINLVIWGLIGAFWWKILGLY